MKRLALAIVLVLAGAALCFIAVRSLLIHEDLVGSVYEIQLPIAIASLVLGAIAYVHQVLHARSARVSFTAMPTNVVSFERYVLPWYIMIVYGVFMVFAVSGIGTLIIWAIGEVTGFYFSTVISAINTLFVCVGFYLVGSWIGSRSDKHPLLCVIVVVILYRVIATIITLVGESSSIIAIILTSITSLLLYLIVALVGLWRGRQLRLSRYLRYLLQFVRPDMRLLLVNQVYEEVQRLVPERFKEDMQAVSS